MSLAPFFTRQQRHGGGRQALAPRYREMEDINRRFTDVIQTFCHFVHFFTSGEAGESWTAEHPGTFLLSLEDAFELGRLVNARNFPSLAEDVR